MVHFEVCWCSLGFVVELNDKSKHSILLALKYKLKFSQWNMYVCIALKQKKVEIMQWPQFFQLNWESIAHVSI